MSPEKFSTKCKKYSKYIWKFSSFLFNFIVEVVCNTIKVVNNEQVSERDSKKEVAKACYFKEHRCAVGAGFEI